MESLLSQELLAPDQDGAWRRIARRLGDADLAPWRFREVFGQDLKSEFVSRGRLLWQAPTAAPPGSHVTFRNPGYMCAGIAVLQALWASPAGQAALVASPALHPVTEAMGRSRRDVDPSPLWSALGLEHTDQAAEEVLQLLCQRLPAVAAALGLGLEEVSLCTGCPQHSAVGVPAFMAHAMTFREENPRVPGSLHDALETGRSHFTSPCPSCGSRRVQSTRIRHPPVVLAVSVCRAVHAAGHPAGAPRPWAVDTSPRLTVGSEEYELTSVILHSGRMGTMPSAGHYATAAVKGLGATLCDDGEVSSMRVEDTHRTSAVAIYDRRRPPRLARSDRGVGRRRATQQAAPYAASARPPAPVATGRPKRPGPVLANVALDATHNDENPATRNALPTFPFVALLFIYKTEIFLCIRQTRIHSIPTSIST